jgi:hypothetical protein
MVNFASARENLLGEYVRVRVTRAGPNSLVGDLLEGSTQGVTVI